MDHALLREGPYDDIFMYNNPYETRFGSSNANNIGRRMFCSTLGGVGGLPQQHYLDFRSCVLPHVRGYMGTHV